MTAISAADIDTAVRALRPRLGERLLLPDDGGFDGARRVWNAAVTRRPALIARCRDTAEVSAAVRAARDAGLPLSVRAGGHDWAGRALRDGGLVVDLDRHAGRDRRPGRAHRHRPGRRDDRRPARRDGARTAWSPPPASCAPSAWPGSPPPVGTGR